ncbi:hypothetical protein CsSME_00002972 [Camellia sinensis var. sinensis]
MIRGVVVQTSSCKCIVMLCLSSATAAGAFHRKRWSIDYVQCRSATNIWPRALHLVDDQFPLADALTACPQGGSEVSQKLAQFSKVQSSANRGNMWHGNGFPSEADRACICPSYRGRFTIFIAFVNGKVYNDPKLATADDFFFSGLLTPQNTSNPVGSKVTPVNIMQILGLNTLSISLAHINFAPYGLNPPHTHPHATKVIVVLECTLYVGFVTSNTDNRLFIKGLIHFQFNNRKTNEVALAALSSQNPRTITVANAMFESNPRIFYDVLAEAFQVDKKVVDYLQAQFWWPNN